MYTCPFNALAKICLSLMTTKLVISVLLGRGADHTYASFGTRYAKNPAFVPSISKLLVNVLQHTTTLVSVYMPARECV